MLPFQQQWWDSACVHSAKFIEWNWVLSTAMTSHTFWHPCTTSLVILMNSFYSSYIVFHCKIQLADIFWPMTNPVCMFYAGLTKAYTTFLNPFLAATKQLYEWFSPSVRPSVCLSVRPSVRLSVTPFWLCSHHPIIMKFSGVITSDKSDVHAKGQGQRSKVKVTEVTTQIFVSGL